jgi:hypothetical protein
VIPKGTRGQGFKGSRVRVKCFKNTEGSKGSRVQGFLDGGIFVSLRQVKSKKIFKEKNPDLVARDLDLIEN